jgi:hypothetical protein
VTPYKNSNLSLTNYCRLKIEAERLGREEYATRSIPVKNLHRPVVNFVLDNINLMLINQVEIGFLGQKLKAEFNNKHQKTADIKSAVFFVRYGVDTK